MLLWSCHFSWKSCCDVYCKWRLYFADLLCGCLQDVFCRDGGVMCGVWLACRMSCTEMVVRCLVGLQDVFCRDGGVMFGWLAGCILQRWWCNVTMCDVWLVCRMYFTEMALWCLVGLQDVFYRDGVVMFGWFAECLLQRWCCDVWYLVGLQDVFYRYGVVMCDVWLVCRMSFAEMVLWCVMFGWLSECILRRRCWHWSTCTTMALCIETSNLTSESLSLPLSHCLPSLSSFSSDTFHCYTSNAQIMIHLLAISRRLQLVASSVSDLGPRETMQIGLRK